MKQSKKLNEGIRIAKEGIEECWDDMGGQEMTTGEQGEQGEQMSVTISMPGKNISVTTDSADEIGNILRLAGITMGGDEPEEMEPEMTSSEPEIMYVGAGAEGSPSVPDQLVGDEHGEESEEHGEEESEEDEDEVEEGWDEMTKAGRERAAPQPNGEGGVKQGTRYGGGRQDEKPAEKEVEESDQYADEEVDESARILQLAGVTNEAQSAAQKAAFQAMIAKKNGGKEGSAEDKEEDKAGEKKSGMNHADWEASEEDKEEDKEVKEDAPVTGSIFGQGVYEQSYARILELAGIAESKLMNSPAGTSMSEPKVFDSLPSGRGTGAGRKDYGANRANNQGENPMGPADLVDKVYASETGTNEAFSKAMGEYRKFVAEKIASKK
jgi:hypothetical protein